jgi:sarcosine oxidase subunit alpha
VADVRATVSDALQAEMAALGIEILVSHGVCGTEGRNTVSAAKIVKLAAGANAPIGVAQHYPCDLVLSSGGWNPTLHLHSQAGAKPVFDAENACFVPGVSTQPERCVGAARGDFALAECVNEGMRAGEQAVRSLGRNIRAGASVDTSPTEELAIEACWEVPTVEPQTKAFVDLQNDVTTADLRLAYREGYRSVEHIKRYTTASMGTDQGKLGNTNVIGILAGIEAREPGDVGTTTFRPPYTPISFGAIAGNDLRELAIPARRTAITAWNEANGAVMFEAGAGYRRPSYYPVGEETMAQAIRREVLACRNAAGMYDGSPLGKFELAGPDVVEFLERVYTNRIADLAPGRARFGWLLREDGRLLDDSVCFRFSETRFRMYCGTGAADQVQAHLERLLQLEWPELQVHLSVVTSQWTNICLCGPRSREILTAAGINIDLRKQALPFMSFAPAKIAGIPVTAARIGYTGELSFEFNVRASRGLELWEILLQAGTAYGLTLVGSEASLVMRCEKGFVSAGFEGDGIVNVYDAGQGWCVDETKTDFIGKRTLIRDQRIGGVRPAVVGLLLEDPSFVPPDGTPLLADDDNSGEIRMVGYVSQGVYSPTLERAIALAVLDGGKSREGESITVAAVSGRGKAVITAPCFVDPAGMRMR